MNPHGAVHLLAAIFTGTPSLPGAACRRRPGLFDDRHDGETTEQRHVRLETAAAVCSSAVLIGAMTERASLATCRCPTPAPCPAICTPS